LTQADAVVVGAGAIGAGCAYELARAGLHVTVVERGEPAAEASGASAGILSVPQPSRRDPLALLGRLGRELYEPLADALREEAGIDIGLGRTGHLRLCTTRAEMLEAERFVNDPGEREAGASLISSLDDLSDLEPAISGSAHGALYLPRSSWVDNVQLVRALVLAAERRGVRCMIGRSAEALIREGDRVTGVRLDGGEVIRAAAVIVAAGAWSGSISGMPSELRVRAVKGQILAFDNRDGLVRRVIFRGDAYLVPRISGECLFGATVEDGPTDRDVTMDGLAWLMEELHRTAPGVGRLRFLRAWAGLRPATEDGLPVIGPWPGLPGLFVATGHFRSGILQMPATARIIRDDVLEGRSTLPVAPLRPDRLLKAR
jgi:glycine oxidase